MSVNNSNIEKDKRISVSHSDMRLLKEIGVQISEKTSSKILSKIIQSAYLKVQVDQLELSNENLVMFKLDEILYKLDELSPEI